MGASNAECAGQIVHVAMAGWHNPVGVDSNLNPLPRVARDAQPWAGGRNPFGIGNRRMGWSVGLERAGGQPYRGTEDDDEDEHEHDWGASNAEFGVPPSLDSGAARQGAEWFPERRARSDAPHLRAWGWSEVS